MPVAFGFRYEFYAVTLDLHRELPHRSLLFLCRRLRHSSRIPVATAPRHRAAFTASALDHMISSVRENWMPFLSGARHSDGDADVRTEDRTHVPMDIAINAGRP
ncbi:hypothetical protein [Nocardia amikacinitolerans]|uniref:hypothetical protein n=1 Tax=Nocardia amikacinitolerans TaxID=756689 RepID=UPI0020A578E8|nr:hypothetical protein [Nocardia amikacinitolerans]